MGKGIPWGRILKTPWDDDEEGMLNEKEVGELLTKYRKIMEKASKVDPRKYYRYKNYCQALRRVLRGKSNDS